MRWQIVSLLCATPCEIIFKFGRPAPRRRKTCCQDGKRKKRKEGSFFEQGFLTQFSFPSAIIYVYKTQKFFIPQMGFAYVGRVGGWWCTNPLSRTSPSKESLVCISLFSPAPPHFRPRREKLPSTLWPLPKHLFRDLFFFYESSWRRPWEERRRERRRKDQDGFEGDLSDS